MQGDGRVGVPVTAHQRDDVQAGQDVAVEDDHRLARRGAQPRHDVTDRAARSQRLGLGDVLQFQTMRGAVAEVLFEYFGPVRGGEDNAGDPGIARAGEHVGGHRNAGDRKHRFRC